MDARELRIGNLVHYFETEDVCVVNIIREDTFDCKTDLGQLSNGEYTPIPLTEEWLVEFGFHKLNNGFYGRNTIEVKPNGGIEYYEDAPLSFVHQLQNLYFALTGEELQFKTVG